MDIEHKPMKDIFTKAYDDAYHKLIRYKNSIIFGISFIVAIFVLGLYIFGVLDRFELFTLDWRFNIRQITQSDSDIVFIDMAEDSIGAIGRWPWPRKWHAAMIAALSEYSPKAIVFDVIFSEPQDEVDDLAMETAIKESGKVYLPLLYDLVPGRLKNYYKGEGVTGVYGPIGRYTQFIKGSGHINAIPDSDGILRRIPAVISYDGKSSNHFGIKIASDILGAKDRDIIFNPYTNSITMNLPEGKIETIPLDKDNQIIVNWIGPWGRDFKHYSYIDIIRSYALIKDGKKPLVDLNALRGKICVIGLTAAGLIDIKPIPISSAYPAVGTNAMVINSILKNDFIKPVPENINMVLIFFISIIFTIYQSRLRIIGGMILALAGIFLYAAISAAIFILYDVVIVTFYPILGMFIAYIMMASYTHIAHSVERARLFSQATKDGLTQLYNIRHFNMLLEAALGNAAALKAHPLSIIMCDIDNFKHVNDTYGHPIGDIVLKEVANIIKSKCRQVDVTGRYGGEEFVVMLSGAREKDAADVSEKIRSAVAAKAFKLAGKNYSTTISLGVVQYTDEKNKDVLIEKADKALYRAKATGKNKVCLYSKLPK